MSDLDSQVALVTGASRGIGRAIAIALAAHGARVFASFVQGGEGAEETVRTIRSTGGSAESLRFDVADPGDTDREIAQLVESVGRIDILVNNAGMTIDNLVLRLKPADWNRVLAVNLNGVFHCTRAAAKPMVRARYGRIINISSVTGLMGNAGQGAYAASKAGIIGFTKSMARELASRKITVNAVAPGFIETEMVGHLPEAQRKEYLTVIPVGRFGTPEEIADSVLFLSRPQAGYITGQVLSVNGGLYM